MSQRDKIEGLKAKLKEEMSKENPDMKKAQKLKTQIITFGLGLTGRDLTKPF
jgi:hypothetical protein